MATAEPSQIGILNQTWRDKMAPTTSLQSLMALCWLLLGTLIALKFPHPSVAWIPRPIPGAWRRVAATTTFLRAAENHLNRLEPDDRGPPEDDAFGRHYDLSLGKNRPIGSDEGWDDFSSSQKPTPADVTQHWIAPEPVDKPFSLSPSDAAGAFKVPASSAVPFANSAIHNPTSQSSDTAYSAGRGANVNGNGNGGEFISKRKMVARDQASQRLRGAIWDEEHYASREANRDTTPPSPKQPVPAASTSMSSSSDVTMTTHPTGGSPKGMVKKPLLFYPDIDMSIPSSVYNETYDAIWELLRWEAYQEAQREPLLVSFLYSTILNHQTMESSLAFLLANRLSSPMLISTQLQSFILSALEASPEFRRAVRADMLAVRDRDPACTCLPDVFLYFKGALNA